jgi:dynein heavy chain
MAKKLEVSEKTDVTKQALSSLPDAEQHIQFLDSEADFAFRQYTLYNNLNDMKDQWKPLMFDTVEFKGVSYILSGEAVELLQEKLDDHTIKTQSMRGSPFIEPFKDEVIAWENTLMTTSENLEVWLNV